jgi:hypothetical protein
MVWSVIAIPALVAVLSLAVDFGRVQLIKQQLQTCADATALGAVGVYQQYGLNTAIATAPEMAVANAPDAKSGIAATVTYEYGTWNSATRVFTPGYGAGTPAGRITVSRTASNNNAVPLFWGAMIGMPRVDVRAVAVATLVGGQSVNVTVSATANPYLAGMPGGSSSPWGDTTTNAAAHQLTGIPVTPGTWISVSNASGTTSILPGTVPYSGPEGEATRALHHGQNQNGADYGIGPEHGIADAVMPASAFMGVFLTDAAPSDSTPPATIDWTQPGVADQPQYDAIALQQPFLIGDGRTTGNVVQRFQVPQGATRLFLGVWDGVTQSNNAGSLSATFSVRQSVRLVK